MLVVPYYPYLKDKIKFFYFTVLHPSQFEVLVIFLIIVYTRSVLNHIVERWTGCLRPPKITTLVRCILLQHRLYDLKLLTLFIL